MRLIDVRNQGTERSIGAWVVDDEFLVDPGPESALPTLLAGLDGWQPRTIALTHIHLDHAGATGALLRRWPDCEVFVHARGAPHLVDPSKLVASAERLYGDAMQQLWGEVLPVPEGVIRTPDAGERIGPFDVLDTPGHARHHLSYFHRETGVAFVGDVACVRIPPSSFVLPPTVPPEFDPVAWKESIDLVRRRRPTRVVLTHFGMQDDVEDHLARAEESIERWAEQARVLEQADFVTEVEREIGTVSELGTRAAYELAAQPSIVWMGARRYWERVGNAAKSS